MSKRTIVKDASYTAHAIDMVSIMIFNSATDCALTLPSPTGLIYADCDVHNKGAGTVTIGSQTVATGSHAHISNNGGTAWVVVVGGGAETDPIFSASPAANIDSTDITNWDTAYSHSQSAHAPVNAQKNSDITKEEIEAKLIGEVSSHSHAGSGGVYYEPLVNGDPTTPEVMFDDDGDIIMVEV